MNKLHSLNRIPLATRHLLPNYQAPKTLSISPTLHQTTKSKSDDLAPNLSASYEAKAQNLTLPVVTKPSMFQTLKELVGMQGSLKYPQPVLTYASYRLYMSVQYQVDYDKFFKLLNSPDTMYSFCLVNFLHIWLVSIPLMHFGQTGLFVRKQLYRNMWRDIETRDRKLKVKARRYSKKNK